MSELLIRVLAKADRLSGKGRIQPRNAVARLPLAADRAWARFSEIWHTHHMGKNKRRRMGGLARVEDGGDRSRVVDMLGGRMHVR